MRTTCRSKPRRIYYALPIAAGAGLVDPAQAGSTVFEGRQAERGGDGPCADPLEASEARSAAGAKVREGLTPNGRDGKDGTGRSPKARRRIAPTRCTVPAFRFVSTHDGEAQRSWERHSVASWKTRRITEVSRMRTASMTIQADGQQIPRRVDREANQEQEREGILKEPENIVRYWHTVELLQPQSAPKIKKRSSAYGAFLHDTPCTRPIPPWAPESIVSKQALPDKREWSHTLYAHLYDSRLVAAALQELYGADQGYREPQHRESALFAAKFTMSGQLVEDSFVLSSEAWFLGRALARKDWTRGFEDDQRAAAEQALTQLQGQVSGDALRNFTRWVLQFLGVADFFATIERPPLRFRSQPVKPDKPASEDDPLNSFLLDDLATVADSLSKGVASEALNQYLRRHDPQLRLHIDSDDASPSLIERLMPQAHADSCWPSERHLGLVHSQQLAVNTVLSKLADGQGLLARIFHEERSAERP